MSVERTRSEAAGPDARAPFDGIVCFGGEDWWYHNRGHFDMQMMRELSRVVPVLYVNSIGMRVPKVGEGRMFLTRVKRKLRSLARGLVRVRAGFGVYSPFVVPGGLGMRLSGALLPWQVRRAARRMGIRRPLIWVACPPAARALERLHPAGVVYQRTDRFEAFAGVDPERIAGYDRALKERADLVLFCSRKLHAEERGSARATAFVDHGVDFDVFAAAGADAATEPEETRPLPRPRVGFVGGIDAHTFDPELFLEVARALPDVAFVLVGACSLPADWCTLANVHFVGRVPYDAVARYMAACDVLIMPWNRSEWIEACNPVKLKEYLAVGRPVVSTAFPELAHYAGHVACAAEPEAFAGAIRAALAHPGDAGTRRARVAGESWTSRAAQALDELARLGLTPPRAAPSLTTRPRRTTEPTPRPPRRAAS